MRTFLLNIILAIVWAALLADFTEINLLVGFILGYVMIWLMQYIIGTSAYLVKIRQIINIVALFSWELLMSNLRVAHSVLSAKDKMKPAIVAIPLDIKSDAEITMLANMITLTPGTLSLDVSHDRKLLYVHGMHVHDVEKFKQEIKQGFERVVQEVFQ
jgi:multicomponent Na+:H+ antiporter subunit E